MIQLTLNKANLICDYYINKNKMIAIHATNTQNYDSYYLYYCQFLNFTMRSKTFHLQNEIIHKYD